MTKPKFVLAGIFPPLTTPFAADMSVDLVALSSNVQKYNRIGLAGYVVVGSTGESVYLREEEKIRIWETVRREAEAEKILIAGTQVLLRRACHSPRGHSPSGDLPYHSGGCDRCGVRHRGVAETQSRNPQLAGFAPALSTSRARAAGGWRGCRCAGGAEGSHSEPEGNSMTKPKRALTGIFPPLTTPFAASRVVRQVT